MAISKWEIFIAEEDRRSGREGSKAWIRVPDSLLILIASIGTHTAGGRTNSARGGHS